MCEPHDVTPTVPSNRSTRSSSTDRCSLKSLKGQVQSLMNIIHTYETTIGLICRKLDIEQPETLTLPDGRPIH